jgi:hypothetical protein
MRTASKSMKHSRKNSAELMSGARQLLDASISRTLLSALVWSCATGHDVGGPWSTLVCRWYHHGWTDVNGPFADMNEHWNVYTVR